MREELFGPVVTAFVYPDDQLGARRSSSSTRPRPTGSPAPSSRATARRSSEAGEVLRYAAGNFYVNDKPTGAVVGQQPFGGARASGTNDKAGSMWNLIRWVSPRTIKETFVPPPTTATRSCRPTTGRRDLVHEDEHSPSRPRTAALRSRIRSGGRRAHRRPGGEALRSDPSTSIRRRAAIDERRPETIPSEDRLRGRRLVYIAILRQAAEREAGGDPDGVLQAIHDGSAAGDVRVIVGKHFRAGSDGVYRQGEVAGQARDGGSRRARGEGVTPTLSISSGIGVAAAVRRRFRGGGEPSGIGTALSSCSSRRRSGSSIFASAKRRGRGPNWTR